MFSIFRFLIKQYFPFFIMTLFGTYLGVHFGGVWSFLPFIFLLLFFYEWNVIPRHDNTWNFLNSLPVSFLQINILRIVFPFVFSFSILFCLTLMQKNGSAGLLQSFSDSIRISSILVVSSLLARGLVGFFSWIIVYYSLIFLISSVPYYELAVFIFCISVSIFYLSEARLSRFKFVFIPTLCSLFILMSGHYLRLWTYDALLMLPSKSIKTQVVQSIIDEETFFSQNVKLNLIRNKDSLETNSILNISPSIHYDDYLLKSMENVLFEDNLCDEYCHKLSSMVSYFPNNWNLKRIAEYLDSDYPGKQVYALRILLGAPNAIFYNKVVSLRNSGHSEVRFLVSELLLRWGPSENFQASPDQGEVF